MKTTLLQPFALKKGFFAFLMLWAGWNVQAQTIRYVKPTASGSGDGSSWANASNDFQAMIQVSASGDAVWVAAGIYKPTRKPFNSGVEMVTSDVQDKTFHLKNGVSIYGSFAGNETAISQRNIVANETILSGDFNDNDVVSGSGTSLNITNATENAYHVVLVSASAGGGVTIDGFTIKGGSASRSDLLTVNGNEVIQFLGGGICIFGGMNVLANNRIMANSAIQGGGIYIQDGTADLRDNVLLTNLASVGGGVYSFRSTTTLTNNSLSLNDSYADGGGGMAAETGTITLTKNTFSTNSAINGMGGGLLIFDCTATLTNNTFSANVSADGGGMEIISSMATLTNNTLAANTSHYGGGIATLSSTNTLTNNTFFANSVIQGGGGGIFVDHGTNTLTNNLFWDNQQNGSTTVQGADYYTTSTNDNTFKNNLLQLASSNYNVSTSGLYAIGTAATGNIFATNPLFGNAASGNFQLQVGSPCINSGNVTAWTATGLTTDALGNACPYGLGVDIGAYEYQGAAALPIEMVSFTGKSTENGTQLTWRTVSETQNTGFEIEQSQDGRRFEKIGFVAGKGTTLVPQNYAFWDATVANGVTYYRLKQVDWDGTFEYSKIVSVETTDKVAVRIHPTKVSDVLTVEGATEYQIFNVAGQFILQSLENQLNVSHLPHGVYVLRASGETLKFVKE